MFSNNLITQFTIKQFIAKQFLTVKRMRLLISSTLLVLFCLSFTAAHAENQQQQQSKIKKQINNTAANLKNARKASERLHKDVLNAEKKLSDTSWKLHQTETKINQLATKLNKSNATKRKLKTQTQQEKNALSQQMQALYTSGKQSHLRLLLKQDDPSDISRTVKYFEYLNQHRVKRIGEIKKRLEKIDVVQQQIADDTVTLNKLQSQQGEAKKQLKLAVKQRETSYKSQRKKVVSEAQKLKKLKRKESRLQSVIANLAAKQARAEKKRKQQIAKHKKQQSTSKKFKTTPTKTTRLTKPHFVPNKPFSSLKGKLSWPVRGRISNRFGSIRNSKQKWKGVIISAAGGSKVHAVARGTVEYSGRLNGYGYLIIIRHDKNYRSLYAYNRSVYKKQGQIVNAGDVIAAVGNSGGRSQNGLYFEIRKGTAHRNPAKWCR